MSDAEVMDVTGIAIAALSGIDMPPGRQEIETGNLATVLDAAAVEARAHGVPEEEISAQLRITADVHARGLVLAYASAEG